MALLNYTTKIDADKTAGEIADMLRRAGARAVLTEYDENSEYIETLSFKMRLGEKDMAFKLPCDWKPVLEILENDRKVPRSSCTKEQAVRVAWRIVKNWIEAQLAIIETKMVTTQEVFLPYVIMSDGRTLAENIEENPKFLLEEGGKHV